MKNNKALSFAGLLFFFIALVHLTRFYYPFTIMIDSLIVPHWMSPIGFVVFGLLSGWMFRSRSYPQKLEVVTMPTILNKKL